MTNVNAAAADVMPQAGANTKGQRIGKIDSVAKAAQNDTVTITNASTVDAVEVISCIDDTTGAFEAHTISNNVVTMTSATTGAKTLWVYYK